MIVVSRRCLFNILFQIFPLEKMLNANYYLLDVKQQSQLDMYRDSMVPEINYDSDGNYSIANIQPTQTLTQYHINCGQGELDPTQFLAQLITGSISNPADVQHLFQTYLKKETTKINVFDFLFATKPKGNEVQLLVIYNEEIVMDYAHTICQYLAYEFGCDINFVDPLYRPDVKGNRTYQGNFNYIGDKNRGYQLIRDLKDYKLRMDFDSFVLQTQGQMNAKDQLASRLNIYDIDQLLYLYNIIFPNKPLPPNYYEKEQVKEIIINMTLKHVPNQKYGNNLYTNSYINALINEYEDETLEDSDIYDYLI